VTRGAQHAGPTTVIITWAGDPGHQQACTDRLARAFEQMMHRAAGLLSARVHASVDGARIVVATQWESHQAFDAWRAMPEAQALFEQTGAAAQWDTRVYAHHSTYRPVRALHNEMVDRLVSQGFRGTPSIETALRTVPRHLFVPGVPLDVAYSQDVIVTRRGPNDLPLSSSSMPSIMALMLEQLDVRPGHHVLEIGAGTGYNAALLAALAGPEGEVTTIDLDETIVREARDHLDAAGYARVRTLAGDGWLGAPQHAPYDRIEVTVGVSDLSPAWAAQLRDGGRLVAPLWLARGSELSVGFRKDGERLRSVGVTECGFMRLRGPHAGAETFLNVRGWTVRMDAPDADRAAALEALLALEPRVEAAPPAPRGWRTRLLLEEPRALFLGRTQGSWWHAAHGILDTATPPSLAFVTSRVWDHRLYTYGGPVARDALLERLTTARSLHVEDLTIEVLPRTAPAPSDAIVLARPHFLYAIRERP